MNKKKFIIYAHSAVKPQQGEYSNINTQIQLLKGLAKKKKLEVADIISEYGSGMFDKRPGLMKLLKRLKKGEAKGILCTSWDRLTRDAVFFLKLEELFNRNGIQIITLSEYGKNPLFKAISLSMIKKKIQS